MTRTQPEAFKGVDRIPSYWNHTGPLQHLSERLEKLVPQSGSVKDPKKNPALEKFRKASNGYYDLYNNGLCNRAAEFRSAFGFSGTTATASQVEDRLNIIIIKAAKEQGLFDKDEAVIAGLLGAAKAVIANLKAQGVNDFREGPYAPLVTAVANAEAR